MCEKSELFGKSYLAEVTLERTDSTVAASVKNERGIFWKNYVTRTTNVELSLRGEKLKNGASVETKVSKDLQKFVAERRSFRVRGRGHLRHCGHRLRLSREDDLWRGWGRERTHLWLLWHHGCALPAKTGSETGARQVLG